MPPRLLLGLALAGLGVWAAASWLASPPSDGGDASTAAAPSTPRASDPSTLDPLRAENPVAPVIPAEAPTDEPPASSPDVPPHPTATMPTLRLTKTLVSTDGARKLNLWVNPRVIVQFNVHKGRRVPPVAGAEPMETGATTWLWVLPADQASEDVAAVLNERSGGGDWAPLVHDGPSSSSPRRAPSRGVIVRFEAGWDADRVAAWAEAEGFGGSRRLPIGPDWYVLDTRPGLDAIERAAALLGREGIVSAAPNWWRPRAWK